MKSLPKSKLDQVVVGSNIAHNRLAHRKSYLVIIDPNSHEKLTKLESVRTLLRINHLEHYSHILTLFSLIHMKS